MVQLGLKSGQVHLRACSVNLSAESAWDGWSQWNDLSLRRAGPTSIKMSTPVLSRPSSPSHTKRPRAAHEWLIVRGLSFPPHKSYLINCEHFPPKRHSLIVRLTSIPPCFCLSVQNVTNHRVFSLLQNWLFFSSVYPRCIHSHGLPRWRSGREPTCQSRRF